LGRRGRRHLRQRDQGRRCAEDLLYKGPNASVSSESILAEAKRLQALDGGELYVKEGDAAGTIAKAAKVVEAEYTPASTSIVRWSR